MNFASVTLPAGVDGPSLAIAAGQPDPLSITEMNAWHGAGEDGTERYFVRGVTQEALDAALAAYVDPPELVEARITEACRGVDKERDRRIALDFEFQGKMFQARPEDVVNIGGAGTSALAAIVAGAQPGNLRWSNPAQDFVWITSDNSLMPMDAHTCIAFANAYKARRTQMIFIASAIKARMRAGERVHWDQDAEWLHETGD
jgi:hypothetical protein